MFFFKPSQFVFSKLLKLVLMTVLLSVLDKRWLKNVKLKKCGC